MAQQIQRPPRRVLIVSADMGEGHNATGRALEESARELWPGCEVHWLDALDVMGRGVGPAFRGIYVTNVQTTPWLYEFFYAALLRARWFADASKRFVGAWCGRRLDKHLRRLRPDLIISTYPLGSAGLDWLRKHRKLDIPVGAWVSDFAPHPFWIYDGLDAHYVTHARAVEAAHRCVPGAPATVAGVPVVHAFSPGDRTAARDGLGLPEDAFIALVSCGSLGFGDVTDAVAELLAASPRVLPVVACGRNEELRARVAELGGDRVRTLGWTDRMPELTVAADVVVTNAGGATSLEALACGRAVLMYRPIAAHGKANAALMADAGLAQVTGKGELTGAVRGLLEDPQALATMEKAATDHAASRSAADDLAELASLTPAPAPRPLRAADAMFLHVETPQVPQQVGAVLMFDRKPDGRSVTLDDVRFLLSAAPRAGGALSRGSRWRRPSWRPERAAAITEHITETNRGELAPAMDEFFSVPVTADLPAAGTLVHGLPGGQSALMFKLHHALGDGMVVIASLVGRARGEQFIVPSARDMPPLPAHHRALLTLRRLRLIGGGLLRLARGGRAPANRLAGPVSGPQRRHGFAQFPAKRVLAAADATGVRRTEFLLAVLAEALHRVAGPGERVRAMVTRSTRDPRTFRLAGNYTGAASVDLPTAAMPFRERARQCRTALRRQVTSGAPETAALVLRLIGLAPPWLHAWLCRRIYSSTWFSVIASMLPGEEDHVDLNGAEVTLVYPVLALAPGVGMSVGLMSWRGRISICLSAAPHLAPILDDLIATVHTVLDGIMPEGQAG